MGSPFPFPLPLHLPLCFLRLRLLRIGSLRPRRSYGGTIPHSFQHINDLLQPLYLLGFRSPSSSTLPLAVSDGAVLVEIEATVLDEMSSRLTFDILCPCFLHRGANRVQISNINTISVMMEHIGRWNWSRRIGEIG